MYVHWSGKEGLPVASWKKSLDKKQENISKHERTTYEANLAELTTRLTFFMIL